MGLFPQGFKVENTSAGEFIKLPEPGMSLRVLPLGGFAAGFEYWTEAGQCVRSKDKFSSTPDMRKLNKFGKPETVKQWVAMTVYDYETRQVGILFLTQKGLMSSVLEADKEHDLSSGQVALKITTNKSGQQISYNLSTLNLMVARNGQVVTTELGSQTPNMDDLGAMANELDLSKLYIAYNPEAATPQTEDTAPPRTSAASTVM